MSVISDIKMILESNNIHLLHDAESYLEQIERWDAIKNADLVEVVRCNDCEYYDNSLCGRFNAYGTSVEEDDYCSYGERKEE